MNEQDQRFAFAVATMIGLVSRGASPAEVRDTLWQYVDFAIAGQPKENE
jgi:hypothetical protein